jgi:hypothetical protein
MPARLALGNDRVAPAGADQRSLHQVVAVDLGDREHAFMVCANPHSFK